MTTTQSRIRLKRRSVVGSLLLSLAVFAIALAVGVLISGSAPAGPARQDPQPQPVSQERATTEAAERTFAESMIYSGALALGLSVAGLVMISRRRRHW
jgi:hypothetical protein